MIRGGSRWLGSLSACGVAITIAVVLIALHGVLLGSALQRGRVATALRQQLETLRYNLGQVDEVEAETLAELNSQLQETQAEIDQLQAELPSRGAPYPAYESAYDFAQDRGLQLQSVSRLEMDELGDEAVNVNLEVHAIEAQGDPTACVDFIQDLEADGGATVATAAVTIEPDASVCSFRLLSVWRPDAAPDAGREG